MLRKTPISIFILLFILNLPIHPESEEQKKKLQKTNTEVHHTFFNINNISTNIWNNGDADHSPIGNSGFIYPKGSDKRAVYESGFVWGAKINGEIRVGGSTFNSGLRPGKILADGTAEDPQHASVRVYRVRPDYTNADLSSEINDGEGTEEEIRNQYEMEWNEWPAIDGAPFNDLDGNGIYNPQNDIPGVEGADQTLWFVANDLDSNKTKELYGSLPLGIEMQVTVWGYADRDLYSNMIFKKYKLINKSNAVFDSMYISIWSDPDLGFAGDDFVGCDITLNMDYVYNGDPFDDAYYDTPPSLGFVLLEGPINDLNEKLGMTSFHYIQKHGDDNFHAPRLGDYEEGSLQYYNFMQGKIGNGSLFPIPDVFGGGATRIPYSGDPINGTGYIEGVITVPQDRRMAIGSGPFLMEIGTQQEIIIAEVIAQGKDNLNSIQLLKNYVKQIPKDIKEISTIEKFQIPIPPTPQFSFKEFTSYNEIELVLDNHDEMLNFENNGYAFQGYNIYQLTGNSYRLTDIKKIATYDIIDGTTKIYDKEIETKTGNISESEVQNGSDSGVNKNNKINYDFFLNSPLVKGKEYSYGVSAYYYNKNSGTHQKTIESSWEKQNIIFQDGVNGLAYGDTLEVEITSEGKNEILVQPIVVNPSKLKDHSYSVTLHNVENKVFWNLTNVTIDSVVLEKQELATNRYSEYSSYYQEVINSGIATIDGMLVVVTRNEFSLGEFIGNGISIVNYIDEEYEDFNIWNYPEWNFDGQDRFSINSALSNGNIEDIYIDAKYTLPYDYELRFTENENFAIDYWDNNKVISVPFELWNIGIDTPNYTADDIRMIPFIKMQKDTNHWTINSSYQNFNLFYQGNAKPSSDWIYWMKSDVESGGYENFANICKTVGLGAEYDTTMDNSTHGFYADFQGGFNYVMGNMQIVDYDKDGNPPPAGTTVRFSTLKPVSEEITYTFTSVKPTEKISPNKYELFQNYPNPFNPNTTIRFYLPEDGIIILTLYNILGQKVKDLLNKDMLAGKYEVPLDGSNLASGVYIYRLDCGNKVETRKMILLK